MAWDKNRWRYRCSDGFRDSFWKTVVESPQWGAWKTHVFENLNESISIDEFADMGWHERHPIFDVDECEEYGWISQEHFQAFVRFLTRSACSSVAEQSPHKGSAAGSTPAGRRKRK